MRRWLAAGLVVVALGACSSGSKDAASTTTTSTGYISERTACDQVNALDRRAFGNEANGPDMGWTAYSRGLPAIASKLDPSARLVPILQKISTLGAQQASQDADVPGLGEQIHALAKIC